MANIDFYTGGKLMTGQLSETHPSMLLRTTMENGIEKQTRRTTVKRTLRDVAYLFTAAEYEAFKTWFDETAKHGVLFFNWVDPIDNVTKDARIINGEYSTTPVTAHLTGYYVSFQIETYG